MKKLSRKIYLGDRVEHATKDLGVGTVWELRPRRVSVHWDRDRALVLLDGKAVPGGEVHPSYNKRHYRADNLIHAL